MKIWREQVFGSEGQTKKTHKNEVSEAGTYIYLVSPESGQSGVESQWPFNNSCLLVSLENGLMELPYNNICLTVELSY